MTKILFVCHGNICRSPMAEFIMKYLVDKDGMSKNFFIASAATSTEEIGNDIYPPAKRKLNEKHIPFQPRSARQITENDYYDFDYIIVMDSNNMRNINHIIPQDPLMKIHKLMDFSDTPGDVADPWYTGDFEKAYEHIFYGCLGLLSHIKRP